MTSPAAPDAFGPSLPEAFGLSLVVPVHDDAAGLIRVVGQAAETGLFAAVIVVDDASSDPVTRDTLATAAETLGDRLQILRLGVQGGAGRARNEGLGQVATSHVLFFDSDDWFLPGLAGLVADIAGDAGARGADFTLFRHSDSRMRTRGRTGPLASDQAIWDQVVPKAGPRPTPLPRAAWPAMVRISAYPWNKIYRTDFLRENAVRCTEIPVHNDVELHWSGFLAARTVRVSTVIACEHVVAVDGARLTNRKGTDRFEVFAALRAVAARISAAPGRLDFLPAYLGFELDLFGWITGTLAPDLRAPFADLARAHLLARDPHLFRLAALADPAVAERVLARLRRPR